MALYDGIPSNDLNSVAAVPNIVQTTVTSPTCTIFSCDITRKNKVSFLCTPHENMVSYERTVVMSDVFPCWTRIMIHLAGHTPQENSGIQVRTRTWNHEPREFSNQSEDKWKCTNHGSTTWSLYPRGWTRKGTNVDKRTEMMQKNRSKIQQSTNQRNRMWFGGKEVPPIRIRM